MHPARSALLTLILSLTLFAPASTAQDARIGARIRHLVEEHTAQGATGSASRLSALVSLGLPAVPAIFQLFGGESNSEGQAPLIIDGRGEALLFEAMRAWPAEQVASRLAGAMGPDATINERFVVVRLLGEVGTSRSMRTLVAVVEPIGPVQLGRPYLRTRITTAILNILERDRLAYQEVQEQLARSSDELVPPIVEALGRASGADSITVLESILEGKPSQELRVAVLRAMGGLDVRGRAVGGQRVAKIMGAHLADPRSSVRRQAVDTLRRIRDTAHLAQLIAAFGDSDSGVSAAALRAVHEITGLGWPAQSKRWAKWHDSQLATLASQKDELEMGLMSEDPARASKALRRLAEVRVARKKVATSMATGLDHENEDLAISAIRNMSGLDEPSILPRLIDCLYDPRIKVRTAALRELRRMTGADAGTDAKAWLEWLY